MQVKATILIKQIKRNSLTWFRKVKKSVIVFFYLKYVPKFFPNTKTILIMMFRFSKWNWVKKKVSPKVSPKVNPKVNPTVPRMLPKLPEINALFYSDVLNAFKQLNLESSVCENYIFTLYNWMISSRAITIYFALFTWII